MSLRDKIESREAVVSVIGLGYVGLPLAVAFAEAGFHVVGIDVDKTRIESINRGESYIQDVPSGSLAQYTTDAKGASPGAHSSGKLTATTDFDALCDVNAAIICVPTPLSKTKDPDMSHVVGATDEIAKHLHDDMLIVLESTSYPGTTEELVLPRLRSARDQSFIAGQDLFLAFSPERIDPGSPNWTIRNTPKVIGGVTPRCLEMATALYQCAVDTIVPASSTRVAEMTKLLENTFRAVNIGLVNELAIMCDRLGVDVWEVIESASSKPFGFMPFYPGPGLGGHCIPIDPQYLAWKMRTLDYQARFIQLATEINYGMPNYVLGKIVDALNERGRPINGSSVLVVGVAYKADVGDTRESPALDLIALLKEKGAEVTYHDPHVPTLDIDGLSLASVALTEQALRAAHCVVIMTPHRVLDWKAVVEHSKLVVDTRNATKGIDGKARIVKL